MRGLVNGLQNRLHPFESGTDLTKKDTVRCIFFVFRDSCLMYDSSHNIFRHYMLEYVPSSQTGQCKPRY